MTTKHTIGPWFCENGDNQWRVWDDEGWACICDVHTGVESDPSGATHAHLIAAAPDLLGMLELMAAQHFCGCRHPACKRCKDDDDCADVIAKAKGETK